RQRCLVSDRPLEHPRLFNCATAKWPGRKRRGLGRQFADRTFSCLRRCLSYFRSKHLGYSPLLDINEAKDRLPNYGRPASWPFASCPVSVPSSGLPYRGRAMRRISRLNRVVGGILTRCRGTV